MYSVIKQCSVVVQKWSKEEISYHCKPCFVLVKLLPECDVAKVENVNVNVKNNIKSPGKGNKLKCKGKLKFKCKLCTK